MARASKLTPEQWALARQRWEGVDAVGFAWLAREIEAAWGVQVLRKSLEQMANRRGWQKRPGGSQESLTREAARGHPPATVVSRLKPVKPAAVCLPAIREHCLQETAGLSSTTVNSEQPCGIYFLFLRGVVVYVGQSRNWVKRVGTHVERGQKTFDSTGFMACEPEALNAVESALIQLLRPALNRRSALTGSMVTTHPIRLIADGEGD